MGTGSGRDVGLTDAQAAQIYLRVFEPGAPPPPPPTTSLLVIRPPTITGVTPLAGAVGTLVTLLGSNLNSVTGVMLGSTDASAFTPLSPTALRFTVPAGATTGRVTVTNRAGTALSAATFRVTP
jgi:hypothetical protein